MRSGLFPLLTVKRLKVLVALAVIGTAAGLFIGFGPPGLYAKSGSPDFCAGCHVMEANYENWFQNGGHRGIQCVDCHLPNDNPARQAFWKSVDGMKDVVVFYSGKVPEKISLSAHGAAVVHENCRRCHEQTVSQIRENRRCWECHRRLSHLTTGTLD
jgi:cytochrome c nitrite reductase small subunit